MGVSALCTRLGSAPKTTEQRARRAVERGLSHIASLGLEDYNNEFFVRYSARLFPFQEVRAEMAHLQGNGPGGKANLKMFLDGLLVLVED
jgi:two-component system response regulator YcbB